MTRLFVIDDRDQTIEMCHRHLGQFDYVTRCDRDIPCQVCDERDKGCPLKCAHDYIEAAETLKKLPTLPDLVVLDLNFAIPEERLLPEDKTTLPRDAGKRKAALTRLRREQGLLILNRLREEYPRLPVVMLTTTDVEVAESSQADLAADPLVYFSENEIVDSRTLVAAITRALNLQHDSQEGTVFWGAGSAMAELRRQLQLLARSPLPVLLQGETGTGKSFLAENVIHPRSGRKGPLVVTDLSTIPTTLLPAHLFGAKRGSFTGAVQDQAGVFEQAHGGTLFLDEIANLDSDLQKQLLLVLERGEVQRLGDAQSRKVDVKVVAATNEDLDELVRHGRFRADLFMRLNPATRLHVPPLRDRREDLESLLRFALLQALTNEGLRPLVRQYLARFPTPRAFDETHNAVFIAKPSADRAPEDAFAVFVRPASLRRMTEHAWPGNMRELRAVATNAIVSSLIGALDTPDMVGGRAPAVLPIADTLIAGLLAGTNPTARTASSAGRKAEAAVRANADTREVTVAIEPAESLSQVSVQVEKQYMRALFQACDGDLERVAQWLLGPDGNARQVHLRLNQLGLGVKKLREDL